jgi:hypothetical protein
MESRRISHQSCARPSGQGVVAAVRLAGARISGLLDLVHAEISVPVYLHGRWLEKAPDLRWSRIRHFDLSESHFPALNAESAHTEGDLVMSGCVAKTVIQATSSRKEDVASSYIYALIWMQPAVPVAVTSAEAAQRASCRFCARWLSGGIARTWRP